MRKRILSLALSICMLFSLLPMEAIAVSDVPCGHHPEHTPDCGYADPVQAVPCGHVCDETCSSAETACQHVHDEACGYAQGSEGAPCSFQCQDCASEPSEEETPEPALLPVNEPAPVAETSNIAYLNTGALWSASLYDYAVWAWPEGGNGHWVSPAGEPDANGWTPFDVGSDPNVIFAAIKKGQATDWNNKVFQTVDLKYDPETPYFTLAAETNSEGKFTGIWEATVCSHSWTEKITHETSCSQNGLRLYTCSLCGRSYDEIIPRLPHTWNENNVCSVCGTPRPMIYIAWEQMYLDTAVTQRYDPWLWVTVQDGSGRWVGAEETCEFAGHSAFALEESDTHFQFTLMPEGAEPSWENCALKDLRPNLCPAGQDRHYVLRYYYEETGNVNVLDPIAACEHQWEIVEKTPVTCTQDGVFACTCETCQWSYTRRTPATGHSKAPENLTVVTPATCTAEGEGTYTCETCQETVTVTIPATGHKYVHAYDNPPTCTADGVKINRCEYCQEEAQGEAIPATGHSPMPEDPEKLTVVTAPDCYTDGESTYVCENCKETVSVTVPTTGHNFQPDEVIEAPGCTTTGGQIYLCVNPGCNESTGRDLPALGHDLDENHVCKRCNQEATILLTAADGSTAYYISMFSALREANNIPGGATILLLKDTTWYEEYSPDQSHLSYASGPVVLDLNDCTLTYENPNGYAYDYYDSELTIKNGRLYVESGNRIFNLNNCRFTMENVTVATHFGFADLICSVGSQSRITMTGVTLECNAGNSALNLKEGTAELTDCIFYTGTEANSDNNAIHVGNTATLRINSGRYKYIYSVEAARSVYEFIDTAAHDYRRFNGFHCYTDGYSLGREVSDVDVVPVPFKAADPPELPETQIGRPVTLVPAYTPNVEDFEPEQMELVWYFLGPKPPYTEHEDGSITITPSEAGTVTARCCYSYQNYSIIKTYEFTVTGCTAHSYDSRGLCRYCKVYQPAEDTDGDGYLEITNPGNLWWFSQQVNNGNTNLNAVLTADLDLSTTCGEGIGNWLPIGNNYSGHFNGQGFTISGIYMTGNDQYVGLFGYVRGATIENVTVTGSVSSTYHSGESYRDDGAAGGVVAYLYGGTIRNCHVDMTVVGGNHIGGICGYLNNGFIENCTVDGTVMNHSESGWTNQPVGGIVGTNKGTVRDCVNMATVTNEQMDLGACLGGIAGHNENILERCTNFGSVTGKYFSQGGIAGLQFSTAIVRDCCNHGTVSGHSTGGIVSDNMGAIEDCYNMGAVSGTSVNVAPVANSRGNDASVTNCYYLSDTETSDGGRTADQFASGQVTYELNGSVTADTNVWRQTIGTDAYPVFSGSLVYYGETFHCDGSSTGIFYHNAQPDTSVPPHTINRDTGICTACTQRIGYLRITTGNTDHYAMTLAEAAALAGSEAAVITLLENMGTAEAPAAAFGSIACGWLTFDLNGKTLLYEDYPFVTVTSGRLTVTGTGNISRSENRAVRFETKGGSVRLQGGTYPNGLVSSYVQIRDLLDDGYLFKTAAGWQPYDLAAGSFANTVSVSVLPSPVHISQVPNRNSMEITQGDKRILSMRAEPLDPADTVTFEWIAGDTTITEADFDLSVLPVGTYSLKLTIRCGDVAVYVQYISLTVNPCAHTDMPNGFCSFCGSFAPAELKDGVYQIANGGNLFWFAAMVNGDSTYADFDAQNTKANAVLTADIDLENREWTPIRKYEFASFDGQGHTISGFSMTTTANAADHHDYHGKMLGLFGWIDSCTIQNFTLRGSMNITDGGMTGNGRLGTIVGVCDRDSVISDISSHVSVKIAYEVAYAGGIVGGHYAGAVSQCIFYGSLTFTSSVGEAGGIAGYVKLGSFDNCGFYDGIHGAAQHSGGIIGYTNSTDTHVRNCCVSGVVEGSNSQWTGAIIGRAENYCGTVENNYFDPGWEIENAFGYGSGFTFTETAAYAKPVEDFLSGEVAWLLNGSQNNGLWKQTIDGSNYQPNFSALPVYRWEHEEAGGAYTYGNTPEPPAAISVDITWGDLSFTYTDGTWNADGLTYEGQGWTADTEGGNAITVTNIGSEAVTVSVSYTPAEGYTGISGSFGETSATLAGKEEKKFCLLLSGKPEGEISSVPLGTVTVTIGGE